MAIVLKCGACGAEQRWTDSRMVEQIQRQGMLRREAKPEPELILELFQSGLENLACDACGAMAFSIHPDWQDDWEDSVRCEGCQVIIPAERIEIFPNTKFCPACQAKHEGGEVPGEEAEYCSRCGGIMKLVRRNGAGLAGFRLVCGACGRT